jgi:hypothetical protein
MILLLNENILVKDYVTIYLLNIILSNREASEELTPIVYFFVELNERKFDVVTGFVPKHLRD